MRPDDLVRIRHMLDAAREATSFAKGRSRADLDGNRMLTLSLVKCIEIIGEAASKVADEARSEHPAIPWAEIVGMRNRLIHAYFDVDLGRVRDTVTADLPPLAAMQPAAIKNVEVPDGYRRRLTFDAGIRVVVRTKRTLATTPATAQRVALAALTAFLPLVAGCTSGVDLRGEGDLDDVVAAEDADGSVEVDGDADDDGDANGEADADVALEAEADVDGTCWYPTTCWDLNGDGICHPGLEDVDGDGRCTPLDCCPPPYVRCWDDDIDCACDLGSEDWNRDGACTEEDCLGPAPACWDYDLSGTCDFGSEDRSRDGVCDVLDCFCESFP